MKIFILFFRLASLIENLLLNVELVHMGQHVGHICISDLRSAKYSCCIAMITAIIIIIQYRWYEQVHFYRLSVLGDTRRETQFIKPYANYTMLSPLPPRAVHLVMSKISNHLSQSRPKLIWSHQIRTIQPLASTVEPQLSLSSNP